MSQVSLPGSAGPARVGPYRLVNAIATGGMGTVYLAVRDDDHFRKSVALKLMRPELRTPDWQKRFRSERQILAQLNHPNIAALIDGGETDDGHLYEVMEYVSGKPIDEHCVYRELDVRRRLTLFLEVCAAVSHAHRYLVVHRDIKPSNVMVTNDGTVKLLDFGIAKLLRPEIFNLPADATKSTKMLCTPLYASPEQLRGDPVSTSSDVYSLGVLLFELLTGRIPYLCEPFEADLIRAVCTEDPVRLSNATNDARMKRQFTGDLDNVLTMALRKEPDERYTSVEQFAADIRRYLSGFPVKARKSSFTYLAGKFLRRNRMPVAAAAAIAAVLTGSTIGMYRMAAVATKERDTARAVAQFMATVFEQNDPTQAKGKELTAKEALERSVVRIDKELAGQPEVQGMLFHIAGRTFRDMGDNGRARLLLDKSLEIRRRTLGNRHADVGGTLQDIGRLDYVSGKYKDAMARLEESLAIYRRNYGERHVETAIAKHYLGLAYFYAGRGKDARQHLGDALETIRSIEGEQTENYADALYSMTLVWDADAMLEKVEAARRSLLEVDRKRYGDVHPSVALDMATLGHVMMARLKHAEAEPLLREALAMNHKLFPGGGTQVLHTMQYLALCLQSLGKLDEAGELWRQLMPARVRAMGENNRFVASDWIGYGEWQRKRGDPDGAERSIRKGIEIRRKAFGDGNPMIAHGYAALGLVFRDRKQHTEAVATFRDAIQILRKSKPKDPTVTASNMLDLAETLHAAGQDAEAAKWFGEALALRRGSLAPEDPLRIDAETRYAVFQSPVAQVRR